MDKTFLKGLRLQNYRGIGNTPQDLIPFSSFNFFVGANNSGKSAVLSFIAAHLPTFYGESSAHRKLDSLDYFSKGSMRATEIDAALGVTAEEFKKITSDRLKAGVTAIRTDFLENIDKVIDALSERDNIWANWTPGNVASREPRFDIDIASLVPVLHEHEWDQLWEALCPNFPSNEVMQRVSKVVETILLGFPISLPQAYLIPAIREIKKSDSPDGHYDHSGKGLIDRLAEFQSPDHDRQSDRNTFDQINSFVAHVIGVPEAKINIPHNRQHVLVEMDHKVLPLSSLGTGVHEVIMLASFCTMIKRSIICMEEPEIHLHPLLQRKFINYLKANTDNQYFIATHSAAFIDTPGASIFHVKNIDGETTIQRGNLGGDRFNICSDLGYRASDLVQSNAILWVEGPSDRIYLLKWLSQIDPELKERVHFSIMFYGGRLLSHLSADDESSDEEISAFIGLRALNRNIALIIDSDRTNAESKINATKQRLRDEFGQHGGLCWISMGREVENYVDHDVLQASVKEVYKNSYQEAGPGGQYDHALFFYRKTPRKSEADGGGQVNTIETEIDKVKVAKRVGQCELNLDILDLRERIEAIVSLIRRANGITS